ncbi:SDR family oxidoreductase [Rhizorhabdus dicambivorans]|uniref:Oxidoreductase n=1 Tax=Rhizorhabdus dicambivorans TaxID=1850238 RepID=A0A2A4FS31_9SPHN|nr:SDR family oxidoreductase [Rhizorhabdus dicambivorans]ATE63939.1 oxidoreductase [Rhizorhabdus dicambivorans]PCE41545.1 oxidoreductase [Rhizorhabdus dicambivorans]
MAQRWFITGVTGGIGRALSAMLLDRGDIVVGTARRVTEADDFARTRPGASHGVALDLDDHGRIAAVAEQAVALAGGSIDVVVNNAGRSLWAPVEETPLDDAKALFATNVFGPMAVMQAFLPHFRRQGRGMFVNISSGCGLFGVPGVGAYCGSKFALEGLSETVALEAAPFGVRVMLVEPGAVRTRFISHGTAEVGARGGHYGYLDSGKGALDAYYEEKAMAPEAVASAILAALDGGDPPPRLVLGDDTRPGARAKFQALADLLAD